MITCAGHDPYTCTFGPGCCQANWRGPPSGPNRTAVDADAARKDGWLEFDSPFTDDPASTWLCFYCYSDFLGTCDDYSTEDET